jgi:hypothetical protein
MGVIKNWFVSVMAILIAVLVLHAAGVNVIADVGSALGNTARFLNQPLIVT